jgi:N-acetylmuramoyl-L-alanine amidase
MKRIRLGHNKQSLTYKTSEKKIKRNIIKSVSIFIISIVTIINAFALPPHLLDFYAENNIMFYDGSEEDPCIPGTGNVAVSGDTIEEMLWSGLTSFGFTPAQTAGIMGNIAGESNANPVMHEWAHARREYWNDGAFDLFTREDVHYGIGLAQWSKGRRTSFMNHIRDNEPDLVYYFLHPERYSTYPSREITQPHVTGSQWGMTGNRLIATIGVEPVRRLVELSLEFMVYEMEFTRGLRSPTSASAPCTGAPSSKCPGPFPSGSNGLEIHKKIDTVELATEWFLFWFESPGATITTNSSYSYTSYEDSIDNRARHARIYYEDESLRNITPGGSGGGGARQSTIFLSPGHGSGAAGNAVGLGGLVYGAGGGNVNETQNVLIVSQRLREKLENSGYNVVLAREDNNTNPSVSQRTQMARDAGAVLGISVHSCPGTSEDWYQEMGRFRKNNLDHTAVSTEARVEFGAGQLGISTETARRTAELSKQYATTIANARAEVEGRTVTARGNLQGYFYKSPSRTTYGDTALEMLFAEDTPWVYSEFKSSGPDNTMTEEQINQYVEGLYNGILALDLPSSNTNRCANFGGYADITAAAIALAQPKGASAAPDNPTEAYKHWLQELGEWDPNPSSWRAGHCGGFLGWGASCDRFVATVLFASGVVTRDEAKTILRVPDQRDFFLANPTKWEYRGLFSSEDELQLGDVLLKVGPNHVMIYVGNNEVSHASCTGNPPISTAGRTGRITNLYGFNQFSLFRYRL